MDEHKALCELALEAGTYETRATAKFLRRKPYEKSDLRLVKALIPGVVAKIDCRVGQAVRQGDTLLVLEAMKMLNRIKAPLDGTIGAVNVAVSDKVMKGQVLVEIVPGASD